MQRAIATIVLIAMLFNLIPLQVFANQDEPVVDDIVENVETEKIKNVDIDKKDIPIVAEDTSRRTESEKHFRKQDGSYEVVLYDGAVRYQVGDEWFDIDNSLDFDGSTNTYKNKDNKFDIKFPKDITSQNIKLKMSDYEVNWLLVGSQSSNASVSTKDNIKSDDISDFGRVTMIGRDVDRVTDVARLMGISDNIYDAWKGYKSGAKGLGQLYNTTRSVIHNGNWMLNTLRKGYTVIDIGMTTLHRGRGLYYGTEKLIVGIWRTRHIWKMPLNYYL